MVMVMWKGFRELMGSEEIEILRGIGGRFGSEVG